MCGCASGGVGNRSRSVQQRAASKKPKLFIEPLEYYQNLDTSGWKSGEKALVRSQINIYASRGDIYYESIRAIQERYST